VWRSRGHSAHVGQEVEVHYRWHALYGRRVRCQRREQRVTGPVAYLETAPGIVIVAAAWILDPAACAGMAFGAPRVAQAALVELHHLLIAQDFRRSSQDDPTIVLEEQDAKPADTGAVIDSRPAPAEPVARLRKAPRHDAARSRRGPRAAGSPVDGGGGRRGDGA
jgi:hypothetical protein